jgi:uncharacterized RmlC-like cupin family protein
MAAENRMTVAMVRGLAAAGLPAVLAGFCGAAAAADLPRLTTAAQLQAQVAQAKDGLAIAPAPTGPGAVVLVVRRERTGEVELHETLNDVLVGQSGHASVVIGDRLEGGRQSAPGEWRGGTIPGGRSYPLGSGDMLWIPAGLPHQVVVPKGGDFRYLAFKYAQSQ